MPATGASEPRYGDLPTWRPERPRLRPARVLLAWAIGAASVALAAWLLPGFSLEQTGAAVAAAALIAVLNAVLPPLIAALRLPFMVAIGFLLVLPDGSQPGGHPAGVQSGHSRVPLGGEAERPPAELLVAR